MGLVLFGSLLLGRDIKNRPVSTNSAQKTADGEFDVIELEKEAENQSLIWSRQALTKAADNFVGISGRWSEIQNYKKSSSCLRKAGRLHLIMGNKELAESLFDRAREIAINANVLDELSLNLSDVSLLMSDRGDLKTGKKLADLALKYAAESDNPIAKAAALSSLGAYYD